MAATDPLTLLAGSKRTKSDEARYHAAEEVFVPPQCRFRRPNRVSEAYEVIFTAKSSYAVAQASKETT